MAGDSPFDRRMNQYDVDYLGCEQQVGIITDETTLNNEEAGELVRAASHLRDAGHTVSIRMLVDVAETVDAYTQRSLKRELEREGYF